MSDASNLNNPQPSNFQAAPGQQPAPAQSPQGQPGYSQPRPPMQPGGAYPQPQMPPQHQLPPQQPGQPMYPQPQRPGQQPGFQQPYFSNANPYAADAVEPDSNNLPNMLTRIGFSALIIGALLALYNVINALPVMGSYGFFKSYFLVEKPIHFVQAYGSVIAIVVGIGLIIAGLVMKNKSR